MPLCGPCSCKHKARLPGLSEHWAVALPRSNASSPASPSRQDLSSDIPGRQDLGKPAVVLLLLFFVGENVILGIRLGAGAQGSISHGENLELGVHSDLEVHYSLHLTVVLL